MSNQPLRVLCLDVEGGYGGSSRSLYESVRFLDRKAASVEVWCKMVGPIQDRYRQLGIPCVVAPALPVVAPLRSFSRNVYAHSRALWQFWKERVFLDSLASQLRERFDLIHCNHESLFPLAAWLKRRTTSPVTMHVRTLCWDYDNVFSRFYVHVLSRAVDHVIFITENEQASFMRAGARRDGTIIYNIAEPPNEPIAPHDAIPQDKRLKVACLSNYSWYRGTDRLVEIAEELVAMGRRNVLFVVAGDMRLSRLLPGALGRIGRQGGTLADYVRERGASDMFLFLGHVNEPERVLAACQVLIKPTREQNPWGRDVLEALAFGKPVLTVGSYSQFVRHGETGILQKEFDARRLAQELVRLTESPQVVAAMGGNARQRIERLCGGSDRAADLLAVWMKLAHA